jgi:osmoprotectant transport system ATP-binding protein
MTSAANGAAIALRGVGVTYPNGASAVHDANLEVGAGELAVLLGPSGSGKSTLLRTINRLIEPTSGTVEIDGVDARTLEPVALRRTIGYVIQAVGLFPHLTVGANVAVVPTLLGWDRARAVDAIVRASLQDELRRIHAELHTTIVFVTHDVDEALRLADRVVVVAGGTVVQADTPDAVMTAPANDTVRALIGIDATSRRFATERPLLERPVT